MNKLYIGFAVFLALAFIYSQFLSPAPTKEVKTEESSPSPEKKTVSLASYFDNTGRDDVISGGVKMIDINTPKGDFKVWTKRVGNNPTIKVLILHGGPGISHEYLEVFDSYFPGAGIEYYHYDQLGSLNSDVPTDPSLWTVERFVEEVEQVRQALKLNKDNFYLFGHSWGGILGIEYALKYQQHIKGLIISNMQASIPAYVKYSEDVLGPMLDPKVLAEIRAIEAKNDYDNPRYLELINAHYYPKHVLRMPLEDWPEPVTRAFSHTNADIYVRMQGPSEFGLRGDATLKNWDRTADLPKIIVPTLSIGATHDTMDPEHMKWIATQVKNGRSLHCPNGSHLAAYDDSEAFFMGLIQFLKDVDEGKM